MKHAFGYGITTVSGSTAATLTGSWYGAKTILDSVFSVLTNVEGTGSLSGITIPANTELEQNIVYVNLTSGVAELYYGKENNVQATNLVYKGVTI